MDEDIKVLRKILNSELFLGKYPLISRVWVDKYGDKIDIVLNVKEPYSEYSPLRDEIRSYIWNIAKMAGVTSKFNIYP